MNEKSRGQARWKIADLKDIRFGQKFRASAIRNLKS